MKLKSNNPKYQIHREALDYPEGHFGYVYDVKFNGKPYKWDLSKKELDKLRAKKNF